MKPTIRLASNEELPISEKDEGDNQVRRITGVEMENLPDMAKLPVYVKYGIGTYNAGKITISDSNYGLGGEGDSGFTAICLGRFVIDVPLLKTTRTDCVQAMVKELGAQHDKVLADAHMEAAGIKDRINDLLSIPHQPGGDE